MNNIESIIDKLKKKQITSDKEFFDLLRLHLCNHIKDRFEDQIHNQKDIAVGLHDASLTIRLMIMGAETASDFIKSIISFDMTDLALKLFSETPDIYKNYILRSGKDFIRSEGLEETDQETQNYILDIYWNRAYLVIERVFRAHAELPGLMNDTYDLTIFKLRDINSMIDRQQSNLKELNRKISEAKYNSLFDEEDQLSSEASIIRNKLSRAEDIKIRALRYNYEIHDRDIENLNVVKLRERHCQVMQRDAEKGANTAEAIQWRDRGSSARLRYKFLTSGNPTKEEQYGLAMDKEKADELSLEEGMQEERDRWIR